MQRIMPIGTQGFPNLLTRLGITPELVSPFWYLSNTIVPVSIVDQNISVNAVQVPLVYNNRFDGSIQTNPTTGTTLAQTGALAAGTWSFKVVVAGRTTDSGANIRLRLRNAADSTDIWAQNLMVTQADTPFFRDFLLSVPVGASQILRVQSIGTFTGEVQSNIWTFQHA